MGWLVLGFRPAGARGRRSDSKEVWEHPKSECPSRTPMVTEVRPKWRCVRMKVLIGVDPHAPLPEHAEGKALLRSRVWTEAPRAILSDENYLASRESEVRTTASP